MDGKELNDCLTAYAAKPSFDKQSELDSYRVKGLTAYAAKPSFDTLKEQYSGIVIGLTAYAAKPSFDINLRMHLDSP